VAATDDRGTDLVSVLTTRWQDAAPVTNSPAVVEHSPCWFGDGARFAWAATDRDQTQLWTGRMAGGEVVERRILYATTEEILVPSCSPHPTLGLVAATVHATDGSHALLVIDAAGRVLRKVKQLYVEPGRPARPAWTPGGRFVLFVADDATAGNPVRALDVTTGRLVDLPLEVSGALEVSVGAAGQPARTMLAVVAVGDGETVRNHVYVADVTELLEER